MLPDAYIVHQINSRARLRLDDMRNDDDFFDLAIEKLSSLGILSNFYTNRTAGSIVLIHPDRDWTEVVEELEKLELFRIVDAPHKKTSPAMKPFLSNIHRLNREISQGSNGRVDLRTMAYMVLMVLTIRQVLHGHILGPALPMLMHVWSLAEKLDSFDHDVDSE